jgi:hypothetical protein
MEWPRWDVKKDVAAKLSMFIGYPAAKQLFSCQAAQLFIFPGAQQYLPLLSCLIVHCPVGQLSSCLFVQLLGCQFGYLCKSALALKLL